MKANTDVKHFRWDSPDAPVLTGENGRLIDVLDACLVNGFSSRSADSITIDNEIATVSLSGGNPYEQHVVVEITGASVPALNSEWRIDTSSASSFTFVCPGVADGAVTGATVNRAGAGWAKPFEGTNLAVYQAVAPDALQLYFHVKDSDGAFAEVRGWGAAEAADTVSDPFPTIAQVAAGSFGIRKSSAANPVQRPWVIIADDKFVYIFVAWDHTNSTYHTWNAYWFGDFVPLIGGSVGHCAISMTYTPAPSWPGHASSASMLASTEGQYSYRGFNPSGIAGITQDNTTPQDFAVVGLPYGSAGSYPPGSINSGVLYPHPNNRVDYCAPLFANKRNNGMDSVSVGFWGVQPGRAAPLQHSLPYTLSGNLRLPLPVDGYGSEQGRTYWALLVSGQNSSAPGGMLVDITGPWR